MACKLSGCNASTKERGLSFVPFTFLGAALDVNVTISWVDTGRGIAYAWVYDSMSVLEYSASEWLKKWLCVTRTGLCGRALVASPLFGVAIMVWLLVLNGGV